MRKLVLLGFVALSCSRGEGLDDQRRRAGVAGSECPWTPAGSMTRKRYFHTLVTLADGRVLAVGGIDGSFNATASAEIFDPVTGVWAQAASMSTPRYWAQGALLPDGRALITGGWGGSSIAAAEIYDPMTNAWSSAGQAGGRYLHTMVPLPGGAILMAGGLDNSQVLSDARTYEPAGDWRPTSSMAAARYAHVTASMADGRVLVAGGIGNGALNSVEIFNPSTEQWTGTSPLPAPLSYASSVVLPDGRVLVAGGISAGSYSGQGVAYDPGTTQWGPMGSMAAGRYSFDLKMLAGGQVLAFGGWGQSGAALASAELLDPATGQWTATGSMSQGRGYQASATLPGGRILAAGGYDDRTGPLDSVEIYAPCRDNGAPVAVCANRVVRAGATCAASASVDDGSYDPDPGPQPLAVSQAPSGPYGLGTHTVNLSATDGEASSSCSATVTVVDDTPPQVTCPAPQVLECAGGGATGTFTASAADNCSAGAATCPLSGTTLPPGNTTVTCSATDGSGNTGSCSFTVTVRDSRPPSTGGSRGLTLWPPDHQLRRVSLSECAQDAADDCDGAIPLDAHGQITSVTSDEPADSTGDGHTSEDVVIAGPAAVDLRAERQGTSDGRVYTIHYTVTDSSGSSTASSCTVSVPHDESGAPAVDSGPAACAGPGC